MKGLLNRTQGIFALVLFLVLAAVPCFAEDTVTSGTLVSSTTATNTKSGVQVKTIVYKTNSAGSFHIHDVAVEGMVYRISFSTPDGGTTPTTNYDVDIFDGDGVDLFDTSLANIASHPIDVNISTQVPVFSNVDIDVSNGGDTKDGRIRIYSVLFGNM
jgi:hypothetical protein